MQIQDGANSNPADEPVKIFFLNSVLRPFQDYFSSYEMGQSVGWRKLEDPDKNHLAAKLGLSHMWPVRGSNTAVR